MTLRLWLVKRQVRKMFRPKAHRDASVEVIGEHFAKTLTGLEGKMPGAPKDAVITPVSEGAVRGDWISAPGARDDRVFYYLHGGGYVWGSPKAYHDMGYRLSKLCKARVFLLDYGLAPEVQAPTQLNESLAGYDHVIAKYPDASIVIGGDSAGGGLAHSTTIAIRDTGRKALAGSALIAPWVDITGSGDSVKDNLWKESLLDARSLLMAADGFRGELAADDPICSALFAEQNDLPPTLLQVGQDEILRDDSVRLAAKIKAAGGTVKLDVWPKVYHVWHRSAAIVPEARKAMTDIRDFCEPLWAA
ncbi:MAG: alpha/beta hydrolase [Kordiimonadales bacterium]|nr:MAG: alpha/beta hydrolase [Kordiimonadales bacterium]